jgi:hypothetical protein
MTTAGRIGNPVNSGVGFIATAETKAGMLGRRLMKWSASNQVRNMRKGSKAEC